MTRAAAKIRAGSQRSDWVAVIAAAKAVAEAAAGGADVREAVMALKRRMRGLSPIGFADVAASTLLLAEAFEKTVEAFANAAGERQRLFAKPLAALARALDDVMDELRTAEARRSHWAGRD